MNYWFYIALFVITLLGGALPLWRQQLKSHQMHLLLAFSGSFLLTVTLLHLLPESFTELGHKAGYLLLAGFFFQLIIQRFTHGAEHGHSHTEAGHHVPLASIMTGMVAHAFMEGIPLGFQFREAATEPSLFLAVAAHKFPEALLIATIALAAYASKMKALMIVILFALITPLAGIFAYYLGVRFYLISEVVAYAIPVVAGAFLHIATTIFYESGTKHHMLSNKKILFIMLGVTCGLLTLLWSDHTHHVH